MGTVRPVEDAEIEAIVSPLASDARLRQGQLDQWDWAASFLSSESFWNLYNSNRHWMFEDFIKEDATQFLESEWSDYASTRMSKREIANLVTVLSHYPMQDWDDAIDRLEGMLDA